MKTILLDIVLFLVLLQSTVQINGQGTCSAGCSHSSAFSQHLDNDFYYVDYSNGNDNWSGTLLEPNGAGDGPFKTIKGAISKLRPIRSGNLDQKATLYLRGGYHFITSNINMDARDSGLSIIGYPQDERPIVSGGEMIPGYDFTELPNDPSVWEAAYTGSCSKNVFLGNKQRLVRARKPNLPSWTGSDMTGQGPYLTIKDLLQPVSGVCDRQGNGGFQQTNCPDENKNGFKFETGDIDPAWVSGGSSTGEIVVFQSWTADRGHISSIIGDEVKFSPPLRYPVGKHPKPSGWRYIVENIRTELDAEGEFFCDDVAGKLFVKVPDGTFPNEDVYVAKISHMIRVRQHAVDITFSDIEFRHSHDKDFEGFNARPAVLDFEGQDGVKVDHCTFTNIGYTAIFVKRCSNVQISHNVIEDVGYFGISVDYPNSISNGGDHDSDYYGNKNISIDHNIVSGCGVINMLQPSCIRVKGSRNIEVKRNDVGRSVYAGMRVGWQPTFALAHVTGSEKVFYIHENHIHDFGMGILNDFGGVYLAANPNCAKKSRVLDTCHLHASVDRNVIHISAGYLYGGLGVSADSAASSIEASNNWLYNLASSPINFNCGLKNKALNNMIYHQNDNAVFDVCVSISGASQNPQQTTTIFNNVVYVTDPSSRMWRPNDQWSNDVPFVDENIYFFNPFDAVDYSVFFPKTTGSGSGQSFNAWKTQSGNDGGSIDNQDPLFMDVGGDDFRLKDTSPALGIQIQSVDLREIRDDPSG